MRIHIDPKCKAVVDAMNGQRLDATHSKNKGWSDKDNEMDKWTQSDDFYEEYELSYGLEIS